MTKKRDYIAEILQKRSRTLVRADRWNHFNRRHDQILWAFEFLKKYGRHDPEARSELLKYVSIGIVACLEGFFRMAVRDLIQHGSPYQENAHKLQDIKLDVGTVLSLGNSRVSTGEFLSHLIPLSSLADINRNMSVLLGDDFLSVLKQVEDPELGRKVEEIAQYLYPDIERIFEQRHIFAHEIAAKVRPTVADQERLIGASLVFTYSTDLLLQDRLSEGKRPFDS